MPKTRLIALNASNGAMTSIKATIPCTRVEIIEDDSVTAQGLIYTKPDDSFVQEYTVAATLEPVIVGDVPKNFAGKGPLLGLPEQNVANGVNAFNYRAADTLVKMRSRTNATSVRVTEFE